MQRELEMIGKKRQLVATALVVAFATTATSLVSAAPEQQTQKPLYIGVIGPFDGPTAEGVTLAFKRVSAQGVFTTPDGVGHTLAVITADATTPQQVTDAVAQFKNNNTVAIFGPDDSALFKASEATLQAANIPVFTSAASNVIKGSGLLFRTSAADNWRMNALADYMITDLSKTRFSIYQGTVVSPGIVENLTTALTTRGKTPAPTVIQVANGKTLDTVKAIMTGTPDSVIAFGTTTETADLYQMLVGNGYKGIFVTPNAAMRPFIESIPEKQRAGIYGVTGWSYATSDSDSTDFLRDYVAQFGNIPTALSANAYDAAVALTIVMKTGGTTPDAIHNAILKLSKAKSLAGIFNPSLGNNDLSASVTITVTNSYGAPMPVARYEDTGRVAVASIVPTNYPAATFTPTTIPPGVVGTMISNVNVRSGPGENYDILGQFKQNDQKQLLGVSTDYKWYVVAFPAQPGWISASYITISGDPKTLPLVVAPATPIPTAVPPPTQIVLPAFPDLALVSAVMNPQSPKSGQPFTLTLVIVNQGTRDAGPFAVATSFLPGDVYNAVSVSGLAAQTQATINLTGTVTGAGTYTINLVLDLNNQVDEGPTGKANNKPAFTYTISS
jgi:ABC-type branched-subunit amino acid transport system substrate-binding protein